MVDRDVNFVGGGGNRLWSGRDIACNGSTPDHRRHWSYRYYNEYPGAYRNAGPHSHANDRAAGSQWDAPVL